MCHCRGGNKLESFSSQYQRMVEETELEFLMDERGRDGDRSESVDWASLNQLLRAWGTPAVNDGTKSACLRFAECSAIKAFEKAGKSKLIDAFAREGLSKGAHRAGDKFHDPVFGFFLASKDMGFREASKVWPRHMASDVLTSRSLPLPGTFLLGNDSWIVQMYSKGWLNLRTGVITPMLGVAITDIETRWRSRKPEAHLDLDLTLQRSHTEAALIAGTVAIATYIWGPVGVTSLTIVFGASALWSGCASGFYCAKRHREDIRVLFRDVVTRFGEWWNSSKEWLGRPAGSHSTSAAPVRPSAQVTLATGGEATEAADMPSALALGVAAACVALLLYLGPR